MGIVIGVDPGSSQTGFGVIEYSGDQLRCVDLGVIAPQTKLSFPEKLQFIGQALEQLLLRHRPSFLALEKSFFAKNADSAMKLGQVRGVVLYLASVHGLKISEYATTEVKKSLTGSGHAEKDQVEFVVRALLGIGPVEYFDISDALALAIHHCRIAEIKERFLDAEI
ncbi:MAG: crossover junction endodeoxyribonuclease RuvC [Oligoflexia bacterium]|nr:crossover junction endodeoxyribonuclease RuvC [Oligoflexia bacterium]